MVGQQRQQIYLHCKSRKIPDAQAFLVPGKCDSKIKRLPVLIFHRTQCYGSQEVEMVDSLDELKFSRSVSGKFFNKLRDAGREDCLGSEQDHPEFPVQKEGQPPGAECQKNRTRFLRGRHVAFMIYDYFRVTGAHDAVLDYADLFSVTLYDDNIHKGFDTRWDEVPIVEVKHSIR